MQPSVTLLERHAETKQCKKINNEEGQLCHPSILATTKAPQSQLEYLHHKHKEKHKTNRGWEYIHMC